MTTMQYKIQGDNLEIVRRSLQPGDEITADAGTMIYMTPHVA